MLLGDIDLNEIPMNKDRSTTLDDNASSIDGGICGSVSNDSRNGYESDELKFNESGSRSSVIGVRDNLFCW